ncbi:MAG: hypothetical protein HN350_02055 [Phycisphaerales bacterium]|jgi:hypothetical protein|nr:hypothetical protein [Phycisphaerales bacterium]
MRNLRMVLLLAAVWCVGLASGCSQTCSINQSGDVVTLQNQHVSFDYDLARGVYRVVDNKNASAPVTNASLKINEWATTDKGLKQSWTQRAVSDELGAGLCMDLKIESADRPTLLFSFVIYENQGFLTLSAGLANTTDKPIQVKDIYALADGGIYSGADVSQNFAMVDGYSGGEPLEYGRRQYSPLHRKNALKSRNNMMVTYGKANARRSLLMGGLTYHDYEKFAWVAQTRRVELEKGTDGKKSLLCYLDLPSDTQDKSAGGEQLTLAVGKQARMWHYNEFRCVETARSVQSPGRVVIEAKGLAPDKPYTVGLSWWRGFWHGRHADHNQSVHVEFGKGDTVQRIPLLVDKMLPRFDSQKKQDVEQVELPLPAAAIRAGNCRIVFTKPPAPKPDPSAKNKPAVDKNVYVSEIWLRDGAAKSLLPKTLTPVEDCPRPRLSYTGQLFAKDPVGKRVDPGKTYRSADRFYIDAVTADPFTALEQYGLRVGKAQEVKLDMYDFPTVCLWYAENSHYGKSNAENTTLGAVNEMKNIADSGFLKYSRAAVRLVPDSYHPNNQQGWWDDKHWAEPCEVHNGSKNGVYVKPYETSKKWGGAVTALGGIPLTYCQTGFRSENYAKAFPEHMLFNKTHAWKGGPRDLKSELFSDWHKTWARNGALWGYDYTDPDFIKHMREVYSNMKAGGIKGLMFDYPASGWARNGGMEDAYSTTAAAYRNIFRLAHQGLGPESYVHERNMQRGTDVSIGLVASMRTENDTDMMDGSTVARCGLRWYKNRVLLNQDTDSKNIVRLQANRDHVRAVLTMAYVTTGRLLLANSFSQFSPETHWDVTRTFPYHTAKQSARPADAFVEGNVIPAVYDFKVTDKWRQVTFYNPDVKKPSVVGIDLAGIPADGALGLCPKKSYHVYDFWNDKYVGKLSGDKRLSQTLRPGEARMMSVRQCLGRPQVVSTNRHLMQGYLDVVRTEWVAGRRVLTGVSKVVGDDPYVITIATNGLTPTKASSTDKNTKTSFASDKNGTVKLTLKRPTNGTVEWSIEF